MERQQLSEMNPHRGLHIKIWLCQPENLPKFVLLEGHGPLHEHIGKWIDALKGTVLAARASQVVIVGPKNSEAEEIFGHHMDTYGRNWAWIGLHKFYHQPKRGQKHPIEFRTIDQISCFEEALLLEDMLDLHKAREDARLEVIVQIREEALFLKKYPIVCEAHTSSRLLLTPEDSQRPGLLMEADTDKRRPNGPMAFCFSPSLRQGVLITNLGPPMAFWVRGKRIEPTKLATGHYWEGFEFVALCQDKAEKWEKLYFRMRQQEDHIVRHPIPSPHDPKPRFTPLRDRIKYS